MQKITTSLNKTDVYNEKELTLMHEKMQPKAETIQKILQFAATYRVQELGKNQFIELFLN